LAPGERIVIAWASVDLPWSKSAPSPQFQRLLRVTLDAPLAPSPPRAHAPVYGALPGGDR